MLSCSILTPRLIPPIAWFALLAPLSGYALDSSYLSVLEEEAARIDFSTGISGTDPVYSDDPVAQGERLPAGMDFDAFENELANNGNYFGMNLFYVKLNSRSRTRVFEAYEQNSSVSHIREIIKRELTR